MAKITGSNFISSADLYKATSSSGAGPQSVGAYAVDGNTGKGFRYALNGAVALVAGNLLQDAVADTQFINMAVGTAGVAGDTFIQVTNGTTTVVPTQYLGGSIGVYTSGTSLIGEEYTITGVTGTLTSGGALNVFLDRPLRAAISTSATVNMKPSPWAGVIQAPATTQTGIPVGVAIYAIPASTATVFQYGWVQTHGQCNVLSDGSTFAIGSDVGTPSGTAGCVTVFAAGTTHTSVGIARQAAASAKGISVFLRID